VTSANEIRARIAALLTRLRGFRARRSVLESSALSLPEVPRGASRDEIYHWISNGITCFREWYQPVDFGAGVIAHQTCPPDWGPRPELLRDTGGGLAKWNFIIKKHIPDVAGMRVLDLGCSSGLFSLELARMGAREVIGIDRDASIAHRSSTVPPPQDVVAQANFVKKAFELLEGRHFPIRYIAHDIGRLADLDLGHFDLIVALCVAYHELDRMPTLLKTLAGMTNHLILQANKSHGGELGRYSSADYHLAMLKEVGFSDIRVDAPQDYLLPLIVAKKH
jgi:SAM-dependent methyltransferase